ncbi:hypothetical protein D9M70_620490 [compost metagenome]
MGVGFIEARTHSQLGLRGQDGDFHVIVTVHVEQAGRAQRRPQTSKACADYQDVLFHLLLREKADQ